MAFQEDNKNKGKGKGKGGKKPDIPTRREWLNSDPIFRHSKDALTRAFERYGQGATRARFRTRQDFRTGMGEMRRQRGRDLRDMKSDFASRGIINSGQYYKADRQYDEDYDRQVALAEQARRRGIKDINVAERDQEILKNQQLWNARNEAALRRIQKYGLPAQGA